ncbi:hypothetical protein M2454_001130 [Aequitasia blattaphilus]|uniref:Ig-like domain-containing protein n=1 Tax=Aequitasia blattaphilus TaxID=2949332 RepID=A0ABT1E712_9FIRM|nr:Ig-like domain-containing protein [Aequitasia blattaphilus]MCP1101394.1 Ig-like domain-containing protein [Aequitasia blattaphilus]MCR8614034.1 Ig-like domain-containing protein [Aequitasia blattaphilus]
MKIKQMNIAGVLILSLLISFFSPGLTKEVKAEERIQVSTFAELNQAVADEGENREIVLTANLTADLEDRIICTGNVTINGNGYTIDGQGAYGVFNVVGGKLTLRNLSINHAKYMLWGMYNGKGSAVLVEEGGSLRMENCTVVNTSSSWGSVYVDSDCYGEIVHCTFAGNFATGYIANTICVDGASMAQEIYFDYESSVVDGGYNLISSINTNSTGFLNETTVIEGGYYGEIDWITDSLDFNPAVGYLPLIEMENSPAMNKIPADNINLLPFDVIGTMRPQAGLGDIGAHEVIAQITEPESVKIVGNAFRTMKRNGSMNIEVQITPEYLSDAKVSFISSNPSVVSVDETGHAAGNKIGTAVITVNTENEKSHSITIRVTP